MIEKNDTDTTDGATIKTRVLIVGGGLAGSTLACALGTAGISCVLIDREATDARLEPTFDGRTTAIAFGSRRLLEGVGIWSKVGDQASPILDIRITDGDAPVFLHYDHREAGDEPFGHIVDNRVLRQAQIDRLRELPSVTVLAPARIVGLERGDALAVATLADGTAVQAELVVGADGRESFVRKSAGIGIARWPYNQSAIACCITHDLPHHGLALEHFQPAGPFAVLPMTDAGGAHRSSVVWTERPERAQRLAALPVDDFNRELRSRIGDYLGEVSLVGQRPVYPLGVLHARTYVARRVALISEAAHAIHPIAGQGLNMGFRDIATLAEIVVDRARLGLDVGDRTGLARYQRWRHFDNTSLIAVTDGLLRLFSNDIAPIRWARDFGLMTVGRLPPARRFFMRHAMGALGQLPRLSRGVPL